MTVLQKTVLAIVLRGVSLFVGLYVLYWITKELSVSDLYLYNLTSGYLAFVALVAGFGLLPVLQKLLTNTEYQSQRSDVWSTFFVLRIFIVLIAAFVAAIIGLVDDQITVLFIVVLFMNSAAITIDYNYFALYSAREEVWKFSVTDVVGKVSTLILLVLYQHLSLSIPPLWWIVIALVAGSVITLFADYIWNRKVIQWGQFNIRILQKEFKSIIFVAVSWILLGIFQHTQAVWLKWFGATAFDINVFALAFLAITQGVLVFGVINTQLASMVKKRCDNKNATKEYRTSLLLRSLWLYFALVFVAYIGLLIFGKDILRIVDGSNSYYAQSAELFPILGVYFMLTCLAGYLSYLNIFFNQEKKQLWAVIIQLCITMILAFALIPRYGIFGASWVVTIVAVIDFLFLRLPVSWKLIRS